MAGQLQARRPGSASTVRRVGIGLGLLLMGGLAVLLWHDRQARIDAAHRQSLAVATGVDRLLHYGLRNLERALSGIAADAAAWAALSPDQRDLLLDESISGVVARQQELHSIVLVDAQGDALSEGQGDPEFPQWHARSASRGGLAIGPLQAGDTGGWWLRLALPYDESRWLLARLHTGELAGMMRDLDVGRVGNVVILDRDGTLLARVPDGDGEGFTGRHLDLPEAIRGGAEAVTRRSTSPLDGIDRARGFSAASGYPLVVSVGVGIHEALATWYRLAAVSLGVSLLYWSGLAFLVRRLTVAERSHALLVDELSAQADWLDQAQRAANTGVWRMEADGEHAQVSAHTAAMFGFEAVEAAWPVARFFSRMHPEDRERVQLEFARAQASRQPFVAEYRVLLDDGRLRWISARGGVVGDARGGGGQFAGTVVDVTDRHEAHARIERAEAQFRALFERNPLPFWVFDAQSLRFLAVNRAAVSAYGYSVDEFLTMTILDIRPPDDERLVRESMLQRSHGADVDGVWTHRRRDGSLLEARVFSSGIEFSGRPARLVLAEDVSDRVAYERDLAWRASHDPTTGLPTLASLTAQLDALVKQGHAERYVVAYVRLRELERLAPTLGQRIGDALLREVAGRIELIGERFGLACHWPGQSFVVVALDPSRRAELLSELEQAIDAPVELEGGAHPVEASIGIAEGPGPDETAEQVAGHAALAALQAWQEQVPVMAYDRIMAVQAGERLMLARRIREALDRQEFELHFQPIQRISDGRTVALEALLRWRQRDGGFVPPDVFIPLAEASGLIVPIGHWILEQAAQAHVRVAAQGHRDVAIAVNVSAVQLLADNVPEVIREVQRRHDLPRGALHVELTESVLLRRPQAARMRMLELRGAGVGIAIDDFGTGFSSMAYLRNLPLDTIKIDRGFVHRVHADERNASICRALIALAHGLGLGTVAEGVESAEELEWLRRNGCDQAQGYYLGRPAPLDRVIESMVMAA
ncbi:EAL domain-containing protein [Luteimonas sp. M1R5S18]|uniref:EAL domain-containing protein n=1 Tax=Luteimonas rhizosphaericola TaxID=3042024 RepID=A0ABT6JJF7_9GAMM|nr:EAL domain-containing protein [Luteimonas rhizosphaericola]MDH5830151.1 EAL domain-containing protein [Luteimonas rhizosphaericola]